MSKQKYLLSAVALAFSFQAMAGDELLLTASNATVCEEPRPEVCTMEYLPVCATLENGSTKTYPNGCGACADASVISWVENACPE